MKRLWLIILGIVVLVLGALAGVYSLWRARQDQRMEILYGPPPIGEPQGAMDTEEQSMGTLDETTDTGGTAE